MTLADTINGIFEAGGAVFVANHCRVLYAQKSVRGLSVVSVAFFAAWGVWNLWFYPSLGQWMSFVGGLGIVAANLIWIVMLLYYKKRGNDSADACESRN